jgi:hypothetical protein
LCSIGVCTRFYFVDGQWTTEPPRKTTGVQTKIECVGQELQHEFANQTGIPISRPAQAGYHPNQFELLETVPCYRIRLCVCDGIAAGQPCVASQQAHIDLELIEWKEVNGLPNCTSVPE